MNSLKKNFIYNMMYQILNLCIPFITVPILSRVLGPESTGIYSYTYSIVNYFMIFGMLGISNYGNRRIAKCREDKEILSQTFFSIYYIQFWLNCIAIIVYILYIHFFSQYKLIACIEIIYLISNMLDISWLYFGIENFKKTVLRNIFIKIITLILIIIFIKKPEDIYLYTFIMAFGTALSQMILWINIKKYVKYQPEYFKYNISKQHMKGILILFIPVISYSVYKIMDKIMLGIWANMEEVGYYEYAEKIISIPLGIINALGVVMLPKMSNLVEKKDFEVVKQYIYKALSFIMFVSIPCMIGIISISNEFVTIFLGNNYIRTGEITNYLVITIIFTGWANVIRTQWLIPKEKDNIYIYTTIIGAMLNFILNFILIKYIGAVGAAVGTIVSEFFIMFSQTFIVRRDFEFSNNIKEIIWFLFSGFIMYICIKFVKNFVYDNWIRILVAVILGVIIYSLLNYKYIIKLIDTKLKKVKLGENK